MVVKGRSNKKVIKKATPTRKKTQRIRVGRINHFFTNIKVAVVDVENPLRVGDKILIVGFSTAFKQTVKSMQINNKSVQLARRGSSIGLKVIDKVRSNDNVFKI